MKIAMVCYASYGGSGALAAELGIALSQRGHSVHFISHDLPFRVTQYYEGVTFHQVDISNYPVFPYPPYTTALASKIIEVHELYGLDIIHAHYAIPHSIAGILARDALGGPSVLKVVTTLHGTDITLVGQEPNFKRMVQYGIRASDGVTSVSEYLKEETKRSFDVARPIETIYNFVDTSRFNPIAPYPRPEFIHRDEISIFHVSNFRPVKNIDSVIRAFAHFQSEHTARLILVGDGPDLPKALELARSLGVDRQVTPLGRVDQLQCILPYADILLLPSFSESFGLALLEAMSCGVPTVSSNRGGLPEVVLEGKTGFLCDPYDIPGLSLAMGRLVDDSPSKRLSYRLAARERALDFNKDLLVAKYEAYYQTLMNQN